MSVIALQSHSLIAPPLPKQQPIFIAPFFLDDFYHRFNAAMNFSQMRNTLYKN